MADTVDRILTKYESVGFDKIVKEQQALATGYDKTAKAQDKVNSSSSKLERQINKLSSAGRTLRQAGGFLGSDTIMSLGNFADGMGDIAESINNVSSSINKGGGLKNALKGIAPLIGLGAIGLAANQVISVAQSAPTFVQNALNPSEQIQRKVAENPQAFFKASMEGMSSGQNIIEMAKFFTAAQGKSAFEVKEVQIHAEMVEMNYKEQLQKGSNKEVATQSLINGLIGVATGQGGLVGRGITGVNELLDRQRRTQLQAHFQTVGTQAFAGANLLQAGQAFQQRSAGAQNMYQLALMNIERETQQKRAEIARSYSQSLLQFDKDYYAQRQQVASQYGVETARMEAEHQKNISRMQEDHQGRLKKLVESRDALAVEDEIDQYNKERTRAEEDYAEMMGARQQDYARQLREMERAHQEQRNERQRAYQEQLRDLAVQAQQKRQAEAAQYNLLLRDIVNAFVSARNQFAAAVTNNSTTNTTNNKSANINISGDRRYGGEIVDAVVNTIAEIFR